VAIASDSSGTVVGNGVSTLTVDITTAAVGAWCYCFVFIGVNQGGNITFTGWTQIAEGDEGTSTHTALYRRQKQSGDTTFAPSWGTAEGSAAVWRSYAGLDGTTPDQQGTFLAHTASATTFITPSITPTTATTWAIGCAGARSTTSGNQPESFTADAGIPNLTQATNTSNRWVTAIVSDSGAAVTQAAHTYTQTLNHAETHGGMCGLFLNPAAATGANPPPILVKSQAAAFASTF
jgi:hypothetical protein